jgi:sodium-dependent phosphate transporter
MKSASQEIVPDSDEHAGEYDDDDEVPLFKKVYRSIIKFFTYGMSDEAVAIRSRKVLKIHSKCIKFENRTEQLFAVMQLFTCSLASFAHGANDIANSTTPLAGMF